MVEAHGGEGRCHPSPSLEGPTQRAAHVERAEPSCVPVFHSSLTLEPTEAPETGAASSNGRDKGPCAELNPPSLKTVSSSH